MLAPLSRLTPSVAALVAALCALALTLTPATGTASATATATATGTGTGSATATGFASAAGSGSASATASDIWPLSPHATPSSAHADEGMDRPLTGCR